MYEDLIKLGIVANKKNNGETLKEVRGFFGKHTSEEDFKNLGKLSDAIDALERYGNNGVK